MCGRAPRPGPSPADETLHPSGDTCTARARTAGGPGSVGARCVGRRAVRPAGGRRPGRGPRAGARRRRDLQRLLCISDSSRATSHFVRLGETPE